MNVREALRELTDFDQIINERVEKIGKLEVDKNNFEDVFLAGNLHGILSEMSFITESINYINKPIVKSGIINVISGCIYINDFLIKDGDCIECFIDGNWQKADIFKLDGKLHASYLADKIIGQNIIGRIRLTQQELHAR